MKTVEIEKSRYSEADHCWFYGSLMISINDWEKLVAYF